MEKETFESSLKSLELIVSELEKGEQPLEQQLKAFEKGVALSRECVKRLDEVEKKVEILMAQGEGPGSAKLSTAPFPDSSKE